MDESSTKSTSTTLCRVATALWQISDPVIESRRRSAEFDEWSEQQANLLLAALDRDTRITEVGRLGFEGGKPDRYAFYPTETDQSSIDEILSEEDMFAALQLYDNVSFTVKVPVKNQLKYYGVDDVPAEEYSAVWDGHTLYAAWQQDSPSIPRSGGHVVVEVLSDALESIGHNLFIQACEPRCTNQFMHTTMRIIRSTPEDSDDPRVGPLAEGEVSWRDKDPDDLQQMLRRMASTLDNTGENFAIFKNLSRRLIILEGLIRAETHLFLSHYYDVQRRSLYSLPKRVGGWFAQRSSKKDIRLHLARVWLCMALVENTRRTWSEYRRRFEENVEKSQAIPLFKTDYSDDLERVESLQFERLETAIMQISERLDSGAVVSATQIGALAGGFTGGAIGLLATLLA